MMNWSASAVERIIVAITYHSNESEICLYVHHALFSSHLIAILLCDLLDQGELFMLSFSLFTYRIASNIISIYNSCILCIYFSIGLIFTDCCIYFYIFLQESFRTSFYTVLISFNVWPQTEKSNFRNSSTLMNLLISFA